MLSPRPLSSSYFIQNISFLIMFLPAQFYIHRLFPQIDKIIFHFIQSSVFWHIFNDSLSDKKILNIVNQVYIFIHLQIGVGILKVCFILQISKLINIGQIQQIQTFQGLFFYLQPLNKLILSMHQLKLALMKDNTNLIDKTKNTNNSKSDSMWVFEDDSNQSCDREESLNFNHSTQFLQSKLMELFKKDNKLNQNIFDRVIQEFQQNIGEGKSQISYLLIIQDKLSDLIDNFTGQKKKFFQSFIELVEKRILQIRKRQKKKDLLEFDKIVNSNFFKKEKPIDIPINNTTNTFLGVGPIRQRQKTASKSRQKQHKNRNESRQKSSDKPLNKLLLKQKHFKKQKCYGQEKNLNQTHDAEQKQQSVSYSAIMSASCAVKQRNRPTRNTKKKSELEKDQNNKEQGEEDDKEKAFVFYRPKKNK